ncbi:putative metalloprotease [Actinopolyspora biskrensis]|uniref:Putative metalloprotease n=1 Tax=Actinopolyspora biskrensis TaxID=1470178 RepID=A0A852Z2X4_9ACTN|nr:neutral zinc metallopeptidase [Actinopolyspora biskrensis]NYH79615.1 putative metalloprotease [Actinopolyspora biskrensis]
MDSPRRISALALGLLLLVTAAGCSTVRGHPVVGDSVVRHGVDPSFVFGTDSSPVDELAATVVTDAQDYWRRTLPRAFGQPWHDLDGGFFSVDTTDTASEPPPCTAQVSELAGNAYYCATVDAIAWDRAALLPVLRTNYGQSAVVVVLAHEMGHAVAHRLRSGETPARKRRPVIVEATADCFAGAYVHRVVTGDSARLGMSTAELDDALHALTNFADPVGQGVTDEHGTAYDRASAFQDGYTGGPTACAGMTAADRRLSGDWTGDGRRAGDREFPELLNERIPAIRDYFRELAVHGGWAWTPPAVRAARDSNTSGCAAEAAVYECRGDVVVDRAALDRLTYELGDQAAEIPLVAALATDALRRSGEDSDARGLERAATCLSGAHTAERVRGPGNGSAADLDEAVRSVLAGNSLFAGETISGFEALRAFRTGVRDGVRACSS